MRLPAVLGPTASICWVLAKMMEPVIDLQPRLAGGQQNQGQHYADENGHCEIKQDRGGHGD